MAIYLTVITGPDEGKVVRVDERPVIVGRSPNAALQLDDPSVSYEHAVFTLEGRKVVVENLSTVGTRVGNRAIDVPTALADGETVTLGESCRLEVGRSGAAEAAPFYRSPAGLAVGLALLLVVIVGGVTVIAQRGAAPEGPPPILERHWRTAYARIGERLEKWADQGRFQPYLVKVYHDAWRLEQSGASAAALDGWLRLQSAMMTIALPRSMDEGRTFASHAGDSPRALGVVMGWDPDRSMNDFEWNTDEAFADAAWWFITQRVLILQKRVDKP